MGDSEREVTKVTQLNDEFRRSLDQKLGKVVMTRGIASLPELYQIAAVQKLKLFKNFNEANDPRGEHDFGSFTVAEEKIFFKIDYYDQDMNGGSEDPSDPEKTTRVLTLMLACEY